MIVTLNLSPETAQRLREKAAQAGQSLEAFLQRLAESQSNGTSAGTPALPEPEDDDERPWRGVCVLPRPRRELFSQPAPWVVATLPRRRVPNLNWLRADLGDE
jgi:hypothetical protein